MSLSLWGIRHTIQVNDPLDYLEKKIKTHRIIWETHFKCPYVGEEHLKSQQDAQVPVQGVGHQAEFRTVFQNEPNDLRVEKEETSTMDQSAKINRSICFAFREEAWKTLTKKLTSKDVHEKDQNKATLDWTTER